ncbi:hypothetical protein MBLNU13_g10744t1 [Cladosporium sp. NU13]
MSTFNVSLYLVPLAWLLAMLPRVYSLTTYAAHSKAQNPDAMIKNPRSIPAIVATDKTLSPHIRDRIVRAESAMINGYDNLGFFAAAVCVGNVARLDVSMLNWLAAVYIGSRLVYIPAYIYNDTVRAVYTRSAVFAVGLAINMALFVLAGVRLNKTI